MPSRNPNALKNLKPCKKGETHNPNGRPTNKLKELKLEYELSSDDLQKVIMLLMDKNVKELEEIKADKTQPMLIASFASALLASYRSGNLNAISVLVDRLFGKAKQTVDNNVTLSTPPNVTVSFISANNDSNSTDTTTDKKTEVLDATNEKSEISKT